jgi:hypothetical protein
MTRSSQPDQEAIMTGIVKDDALTGRIMTEAEVKGCERCGQVRPDVTVCIDPYDADVNNDIHEARLCSDCYRARADDI